MSVPSSTVQAVPKTLRRYTDEELAGAVQRCQNVRQVLIQLRLVGAGGNYETVRARIAEIGLDTSHFQVRRRLGQELRYAALKEAAAASNGYASTLRRLGYEPDPALTKWIGRRLRQAGVDTSHFIGQGWRRGQREPEGRYAAPLEALLRQGSRVLTNELKRRLLDSGLLPRRCAICGNHAWNGQPIPLELDHINGDRTDNRLQNLRVLCPNCHAQTPTWRGRNIGRQRSVLITNHGAPVAQRRGGTPKKCYSVGSSPTGGTVTAQRRLF